MSNALSRAAKMLQTDLQKHDIKVYDNQLPRIVEWRGFTKKIQYGTTYRECRRILKKFIKAAENTEGREWLEENQVDILTALGDEE